MATTRTHISESIPLSRAETLVPAANGGSFKSICDEAIEEFLDGLSAERRKKNPFVLEIIETRRRQAFGKDESSENQLEKMQKCIEQLEQQKKECRTYRILERIGPFLEGLGKLTMTCENVISASPFGVAIAFSGVRLLIEHAVNVQGVLSEVLDALEEIAPDLTCYELIASVHQDFPDIIQAIKRAYKRILDFWCTATEILSNSYKRIAASSLLKSLTPVVKGFRDNIRQDSNKVQNILAARTAAQNTSELLKQRRREIALWLQGHTYGTTLNHESDLRARRQRRTEGTCSWMLEKEEFKAWKNAKHNAVLWYHAPPGTGKSIMASFVIDHLQQKPQTELAYFFYSFSESSKRHGFSGLRSLALQLLSTFKHIPDALNRKYDQAIQKLKYEVGDLDYDLITDILRILIDLCPQSFIVMDGLDECLENDPAFFNSLMGILQSRTNGTSKWFFSSCDIGSIRQNMVRLDAIVINPDFEAVSRDIYKYLSAEEICMMHPINWFDEHEQNFLYARLRCETIKGRGYTTKEEIIEALEGFPKGLDSCYIKALERIAGRSPLEQNLARRVFRILITSEKPITVEELVDALAIKRNAKDHSPSRRLNRGYSFVEDVCSPLITTEGSKDLRVVKLCHKSVKDFLLNTKDTSNMNERVRGFLIEEQVAKVECGMECLTYLNYKRYTKSLDLKAILSQSPAPEDHAYLRYAAIFWYAHLSETSPSLEVTRAVEDFLQSPAFWTCIYVQSYAAPYLFARYNKGGGAGTYIPTMGRMMDPSALFALPLPPWMLQLSSDSKSLDRSFCSFVQDWGELLAKNPDQLHKAVPLTAFEPGCHLTAPTKNPKVRAKYSSKVLGFLDGLHMVDTNLSAKKRKGGKTLQLRIIREEDEVPNRKVRVYKIFIFPNPKLLAETLHTLTPDACQSGWLHTLVQGKELGEDLVQSWRVDPQNLSMRRAFQGQTTEFLVPKEVQDSLELENQGEGFWRVAQRTFATDPNRADTDPKTRLFHLRWVPKKDRSTLGDNSGAPSDKNTDANTDSDTDSDTGTDSDSDSDSSSDSDSCSGSDSESGDSRRNFDESSDTHVDADQDASEPHRDCLIVSSDFGTPVWRPIGTPHTFWSNLVSARHPTLSIIALSYKRGQIVILDDMIGSSTALEVSEGGGKESLTPAASSRELRFSPCGNYLQLLSIVFNPTADHAECSVTLSTYEFTYEGASTYTLELCSRGPTAQLSYRFADLISTLPAPFTMTYWTPDNVVVALPPVTYNPKIVKISLAIAKYSETVEKPSHAAMTLTSPIFFPRSAISRNPSLMYCDGNSTEDDSYLYLALDGTSGMSNSMCLNECNNIHGPGCNNGGHPNDEKDPMISPPVILRWKIAGTVHSEEKESDGDSKATLEPEQVWREWNSEDSTSEDIKLGRLEEALRLRGNFVVGKKYSVPFRSGLDWTRQGVLSCA